MASNPAIKDVALVSAESQALASAEASPMEMFERLARDPNMDVDKFERFMQMYERNRARFAEEEFNRAMSLAQKSMRPVAADAENPQTKSKYASYEALDNAIRPIYTEHGFGVSFDTGDCPKEQHVRVLAYVTHAKGFARTYHIDMPADGKGAKGGDVMTLTHATGAAGSYGMRYLLKMIFNIAVGEEDRDGNRVADVPPPPPGFPKWWDGMGDVAPEGLPRYRQLWAQGKPEYREYVKQHFNDVHEARKTIAEKAVAR